MMKFLDHLEEWIITFLIGAATLIIFVAVVHRYAAGLPIPGLQDWLLSSTSAGRRNSASTCSSGWPNSVRPTVFAPASMSALMCWSTACRTPGAKMRAASASSAVRSSPVIIGTLGARFVWENGMHYAVFTLLGMSHRRSSSRTDHPGSGVADLDRLFGRTARFLSDVFPLPAGYGGISSAPVNCRITIMVMSMALKRVTIRRFEAEIFRGGAQ